MRWCRLGIFGLWVALLAGQGHAQTDLRIATWNIEDVGASGSSEYNAALAVLGRIAADVVAINEVGSLADTVNLTALAADAGYPHLAFTSGAPFGSDRNAILSLYPFVSTTEHTSASLSGDVAANDISRLILEAVVDVPGNARDLTVVSKHWKSGTGNDDEFRRVVESLRIAQALSGLTSADDAYVVLGDVNEEADSVPRTPNPFTSLPSGLPGSFVLGADLTAELAGGGLANDPFAPLEADPGLNAAVVAAVQLDGSDGTRPASGRRLDYLLVSDALSNLGLDAEVYDSQDEGLAGGLPKTGAALAAATSLDASDHLLVFIDVTVPATPGTPVPTLGPMGLAVLVACLLAVAVGLRARRQAMN
ncbi:IPTL-CTERM sorting domain-containing protein [Myxococcota bacterium]|nr:IPTL-CTERM sorting domain-containing protein [Myxococcota bacterium]